MSYRAGNYPYTGGTGLTGPTGTYVNNVQTRVFEIGPINTTTTTKLLLMSNICYTDGGHDIQATIGRSNVPNATNNQSTNIVSGASPLVLPSSGPVSYVIAAGGKSAGNPKENLCGFAMDVPGTGTHYYAIWMSSNTTHAHNYTDMSVVLTALEV
jgi:hypothetical protein